MSSPEDSDSDLLAALERSLAKAKEIRQAHPVDTRRPIYFSVPVKFDHEPHPLGLTGDDLFVVRAHSGTEARLAVFASPLGNNGWADGYEAEYITPEFRQNYAPGRIVEFDPETGATVEIEGPWGQGEGE